MMPGSCLSYQSNLITHQYCYIPYSTKFWGAKLWRVDRFRVLAGGNVGEFTIANIATLVNLEFGRVKYWKWYLVHQICLSFPLPKFWYICLNAWFTCYLQNFQVFLSHLTVCSKCLLKTIIESHVKHRQFLPFVIYAV